MVYRYQNALLNDEELRRRLERLRPERRRIVPIAVACLSATPIFLARFEEGVFRYAWIGAGCLVSLLFVLQFAREYRIVRNWAAAVGTIISSQKIRNGRRKAAVIKCLFRASDGALHLGKTTASIQLAKNSKTLGIIYCANDPSQSMLLSQFWFYNFSPVAAQEKTMSEAAPELRADS